MRIALLTREYPPEVYGGAGVHVEYLSRELARLAEVEVRCFGDPRRTSPGEAVRIVRRYRPWDRLAGETAHGQSLGVVSVNLAMVEGLEGVALVHSHTWYVNLAGHLAKLVHGIPHVATTHSLEPLRPWKAEQLGAGGYAVSRFCERIGLTGADAVVAVSDAMRRDILECYPDIDPGRVEVIHNGIDADEYAPDPGTDVLARYGIDPDLPSVVFVGRVTRQKGITHLLDAAARLEPDAQIVLCAGAPDTPELAREVADKVDALAARRGGVVWIREMLPRRDVVQVLSHATAFCCPSVYEPMGIVNLEAMACEAAVVASAVGGIPEVVEDGVTGSLVPLEIEAEGNPAPADPERFAAELAERVNELLADPNRAAEMGRAGRKRVLERFTWGTVAQRTMALYERLTREAATVSPDQD